MFVNATTNIIVNVTSTLASHTVNEHVLTRHSPAEMIANGISFFLLIALMMVLIVVMTASGQRGYGAGLATGMALS